MSDYAKPVPSPDRATQFFWDAAKKHQLDILCCQECGTFIHPPRPRCRACLSDKLGPETVSGRGTIYTFTRTHYVYHPGFEEEAPYSVALVQLDEDPAVRLVCNVVECDPSKIVIGMPVEVVFEDVTAEVTLPQFRPRRDD